MEISTVAFFPRHSRLTVRFRHQLYSSQIPELAGKLLVTLPSLREHLCTNRSGLPFTDELQDTELGHVFEHVMLAVLHQRGLAARGQTTWNWNRDPIGTYHVTISTGKRLLVKESMLIAQAILTNALLGPAIRFHLPSKAPDPELPVFVHPARRLLFAADAAPERRKARW